MCTQFCIRIFKEVNCPRLMRENKISYWAIAFLSKRAPRGIPGAVLYKLRPELQEALSEIDIMQYRWDQDEYSEEAQIDEWFPAGYSPRISVEQWKELLKDKTVFTPNSLAIMKRFKDCGGSATCTQLAIKYGESKNYYNSGSTFLARRVAEKTRCPVMPRDADNCRWWPILYLGKSADKNTDHGVYIWKLRDELSQALDQVDLSGIPLYATVNEDEMDTQYWWLNANPRIWSFSSIAVGEANDYTLYNENGNKRRIFQNFLDARPGDMIVCYESHPIKQVVGQAKVVAEQDGEKLTFEKV